ncbi:hypothetical protein Pmani_028615 [Petrolisthes manimaculis]|uniref:Uncharacterized protein n=1 Tax=Petrolisthes manimaculis TaxID=1843537 RepID=A0AAE1TUP8_9EUCA|nr:hypothetical protein Pmani_028615 [Petrolisthes manimaculis]
MEGSRIRDCQRRVRQLHSSMQHGKHQPSRNTHRRVPSHGPIANTKPSGIPSPQNRDPKGGTLIPKIIILLK